MRLRPIIAYLLACLTAGLPGISAPAHAASFGSVVAIGGQAADIALDEGRGVLYVANFTASRIDVVALADLAIRTSMHVAAGPSSLALSKDGRYLVITHFGNLQPPASPANAVTIIDLSNGARQTLALADPPLGSAFGADGLALITTTSEFLLLDPGDGRIDLLDTVSGVTANSLPAAPGTPPVQIVAAAMSASGDGRFVFGLTDTIRFVYDVSAKHVRAIGYTATPPLGPRVVSVAQDGSYYGAGWGVFDRQGVLRAQFASPSGLLAIGSHAIDSGAGIIYSQIPQLTAGASTTPVLTVADSDNLTVREQLRLPENLTGRSVLNSAADTMYSVSESGVLVMPVGSLNSTHRLSVDHEDLVFHGSFCQHGAITQSLHILDPGGGQTAFALSSDMPGITINPATGRSPATVQITIDPGAYQNQRGTVLGSLKIDSSESIDLPLTVRILVSNQRPDERGSSTDVPGVLADLLADPLRDRFYVLRQDRNQVLVFDGSGLFQITTLRTGNTPTRMAITFDCKYLLIGHDNSQLVYVYDLDSYQQLPPVVMPAGHYPRSIAASANAILAASRVAGPVHTIDRIDLSSSTATTLPSLGVFQNSVNADTVLASTPGGGAVLAASADGNVLLYDAGADSFTVSRKLPTAVAGAYGASDSGQFVAGNYLLNASLVPVATWTGTDFPSGFAFLSSQGLRLTGPQSGSGAGGTLARVDLSSGDQIRPTRVAEQPLTSDGSSVFTRTLAPLSNGNLIIAATASGFIALAGGFDSAVPPPAIEQVVNAADLGGGVAPGSLISVFGSNLSPVNIATQQLPLPTAIGDSCLTVNGAPIPMMFASPAQINAQLPLHISGRTTMTLYTPGGVSDDYYLNILPAAPAIFHNGIAGPVTGLPVVVKVSNQQLVTPSNPIHPGDEISIYAAGLGSTAPEVVPGTSSPSSPLAQVILSPDVRIGGVSMAVTFAGLAPGQVGVYQIDAKAPEKAPEGIDVPLTITQGYATTSVTIRVVH